MDRSFHIPFTHRLCCTHDALDPANPVLADCIRDDTRGQPARMLAFVDTNVANALPDLPDRLRAYAEAHGVFELADRVQPVVGGEMCKNDRDAMYRVLNAINEAGLDRHDFVLAIGGGAVLDCVGFATAIAHRGMRLLRMPTTTLAQGDSGVGVKNGINGFGQKNYLGTFAVPHAVINDEHLLTTLTDRDWRCGFSEAVKVALLKDADLFEKLCDNAHRIAQRDMRIAAPLLRRSAELHLQHITDAGDPFEHGVGRPLDFGHWAAHRLEVMTDFALRHGEAVAIGLALDVTYAEHLGILAPTPADRIRVCLHNIGFKLHDPAMHDTDALLLGVEHFRAHLGGRLALPMIKAPGRMTELDRLDRATVQRTIETLAATGEPGARRRVHRL